MSDSIVPAVSTTAEDCIRQQTPKDFATKQEVRWCPGCGDFAVLNSVRKTLVGLGMPRERFVFVSGIGCSSRFPYYVDTYGFHTIHGRAPAVAMGVKCANPDLSVWVITGDGDGLSIGTNHLIHCLRRNLDINVLLFNNRIYGLTKGQYSPTSEFGKRTKSSPSGTIEQPIHPVHTALAAQATFVARTVYSDPAHLAGVLDAAARHKGTSFVEILQNCRVFNEGTFGDLGRNTGAEHRALLEHGKPICFGAGNRHCIVIRNMQPVVVDLDHDEYEQHEVLIHDTAAMSPALAALLATLEPPDFPTALGVFRDIERPTYEELLLDQNRRSVAERGDGNIESLLDAGLTWEVE